MKETEAGRGPIAVNASKKMNKLCEKVCFTLILVEFTVNKTSKVMKSPPMLQERVK